VAPANLDRADHVVLGPGHDHSQRDLPVVGGIGGVHAPMGRVETHLALDDRAELAGQARRVYVPGGTRLTQDRKQ
jgi:hypothetical protein